LAGFDGVFEGRDMFLFFSFFGFELCDAGDEGRIFLNAIVVLSLERGFHFCFGSFEGLVLFFGDARRKGDTCQG